MPLGIDGDSDGDDGDHVQITLPNSYVSMPRVRPAAPERHRTPHGRTAVARPPHTAFLGVPGERTGAASQLGERGAWEGALAGTDRSVPGKGADPRGCLLYTSPSPRD